MKLFSGYRLGNASLQVSYSKPIETLCIEFVLDMGEDISLSSDLQVVWF